MAGLVALTFFGVLYGFLQQSKLVKPPFLKNYLKLMSTPYVDPFKIMKLEKRGDIEGKINFIERKREWFRYEGLLDLEVGGLYLKLGELEKGINYLKNGFEKFAHTS